MTSFHEQVREALAALTGGLVPFVEARLRDEYGGDWVRAAERLLDGNTLRASTGNGGVWDAHSLLTVLWRGWHEVFRHSLKPADRNLIGELRQFRNRWAHQDEFDFDDTYRVLDDVHRLLAATSSEWASEAGRQKLALLRSRLAPPRTSRAQDRLGKLDVVVFVICGGALGAQIVLSVGSRAWPFALLAGVSFTYILIRRTLNPVHSTPRCASCNRPYSGESCPRCGPAEPAVKDPAEAAASSTGEIPLAGNPLSEH